MANLKEMQLVLPFELEETPTYKDIVKQNWQFTFTRQVMTSVYTKRVVGLIVAQMKEENDMRPFYQIQAKDIIRETGLQKNEVYARLKAVINELIHVAFIFENKKQQIIIPRHLVDTTRFDNPVGYNNGVLTVAFNPTLKKEIMQLAHYSTYELSIYMRFSSWYSMRLWEILFAFRDKPFVEFKIEEYREWMGCGIKLNEMTGKPEKDKKEKIKYIKYPNPSDVITYTTQEPLKEFANTELAFKVTGITAETNQGKGRPPITKIRFEFINKNLSPSAKLEMWSNSSDKFKKACERLRKYKVHDAVIAKYCSAIGEKAINELLYSWDLRQAPNSKNKIENVANYCTKVFKAVGEDALKEQSNNK
jgi:plasmid replication initiation protein